jgi:hypothetical protein
MVTWLAHGSDKANSRPRRRSDPQHGPQRVTAPPGSTVCNGWTCVSRHLRRLPGRKRHSLLDHQLSPLPRPASCLRCFAWHAGGTPHLTSRNKHPEQAKHQGLQNLGCPVGTGHLRLPTAVHVEYAVKFRQGPAGLPRAGAAAAPGDEMAPAELPRAVRGRGQCSAGARPSHRVPFRNPVRAMQPGSIR